MAIPNLQEKMEFISNISQQDAFKTCAIIKQDVKNQIDKLVVESLNSKDDEVWIDKYTFWTNEQIVKLSEAIKLFGHNWELISKYVGRSSKAC
jgi:hypothetical protein